MNKFKYWKSVGGKEPETLSTRKWFGKTYTLTELFELTEVALGIYPEEQFTLYFWNSAELVRAFYRVRYGRELASHSFMSKGMLRAWFSLEDLTPAVFVHEMAHLLLETNLKSRISYNAHEAMAQWAVKEVLG